MTFLAGSEYCQSRGEIDFSGINVREMEKACTVSPPQSRF